MPRETDFKQTLCADINGFSLHAAVRCAADNRWANHNTGSTKVNCKRRTLVHVVIGPLPKIAPWKQAIHNF